MDDEDGWIRGMGGGDREAWSAMYDRHVGDDFGILHHLVGGDRALAEELNQDDWLTAVQGFDRFDPLKGEFRDWLFGIATLIGASRIERPSTRRPPVAGDAPIFAISPKIRLTAIARGIILPIDEYRFLREEKR